MSPSAAQKQWLKPRIVAEIWWCGDDYCDCTEPMIVRITPNLKAGYPWIHREVLWSGEFLTETGGYSPEEIRERQYEPLRRECRRFGIPVPKQLEVER